MKVLSKTPPEMVGIGAAAGGFDAVCSLFAGLPPRPSLAFVVVQRLAPDFLQLLADVLSSQTEMAIKRIEDGLEAKSSTVYLLPSNVELELSRGYFKTVTPDHTQALQRPVDRFFTSLAEQLGKSASGVILSGGGSDGTIGCQKITEAGGRLIVQQPSTAKFPSMPKAALEACRNAAVLPVEFMADALVDGDALFAAGTATSHPSLKTRDTELDDNLPESLFSSVENLADIDLTNYKTDFVLSAARQCMSALGLNDIAAFSIKAASDRSVLKSFISALSFPTINFFDDPSALDAFSQQILPSLIDNINQGNEVRIWMPVCGQGQEAYAVAALLAEQFGDTEVPPTITIIAQDDDPDALALASRGRFDASQAERLPSALARRFFDLREDGLHISNILRRMMVFERAKLIDGPTPASCDLVMIRNVLSRLATGARDNVLGRLARGLKINGHLVVGHSDRPVMKTAIFDPVDRHGQIYRRRRRSFSEIASNGAKRDHSVLEQRSGLAGLAYGRLIEVYAPASFVITMHGDILHQLGDMDSIAHWIADFEPKNLYSSLTPQIRSIVTASIDRAAKEGRAHTVSTPGIELGQGVQLKRLRFEPLLGSALDEIVFLVSFESQPSKDDRSSESPLVPEVWPDHLGVNDELQ